MTAHLHNAGLVSSCHATTRGSVLDNSLLQSTFAISFGKDFIYKGETIPANTNLFGVNNIRTEITIDYREEYSSGVWTKTYIIFSPTFLQNANLNNEYSVHFSCKTSDDLLFDKTSTIHFNK